MTMLGDKNKPGREIHSPYSPPVRLAVWLNGLKPPAHIEKRPLKYTVSPRIAELNALASKIVWLCEDGHFRLGSPDGPVLSTITDE